MQKIEVDDNVYQFLESKVQGFGDSPNIVLRRLLGIGTPKLQASKPVATKSPSAGSKRGKAPKANLQDLVRIGSLSEGQVLYLHDYRGTKISGVQAYIRGNDLECEGKMQSMSALARDHMKNQGYDNDSYRGPEHWFTAQGRSIKDLWDEYLKEFPK
ncbi:MAG: SeqA protein [Pseudomonadota bacterium]|nr:SeqA protein [Pseudomonadota bacterium]